MRILLDCDGVLANFVEAALHHVNDLHPERKDHTSRDVGHWEIESLLPDHLHAEFHDRITAPGFCRDIRPYRGVGAVLDLRAAGHEVAIVTSPLDGADTWIMERAAWIRKYFGDLEVAFAKDKSSFDGDIFVDDNPGHVTEWQAAHPEGHGLLYHARYNIQSDLPRIWTLGSLWCFV